MNNIADDALNSNSTANHSVAHTTLAANAKAIALVGLESTTPTISNMAFGGAGLTQVGGYLDVGTGLRGAAYYLDSALAAGAHNLTWNTSISQSCGVYIISFTGGAAGAPEDIVTDVQAGASAVVGDVGDITATAGALILSGTFHKSGAIGISSVTTVTHTKSNTSWAAGAHGGYADGVTADDYSVDWTYDSASSDKISFALSIALASAAGQVVVTATNDIQ